MSDVKLDVWEESVSLNSPDYVVSLDNLILSYPDSDDLKKLNETLIKGLVAVKVYGENNLKFELKHIKVDKHTPMRDSRNVSSALFNVIFRHTELPENQSIYYRKTPVKIEGVEHYEWKFGPSEDKPELVVCLSFYPYNFHFVHYLMRIPQRRILVNWESVIVD